MINPKDSGLLIFSLLCKEMVATGKCGQYDGPKISIALNLKNIDVNNGVEFLDQRGLIKVIHYKASPYNFGFIELNLKGKEFYSNSKDKVERSSIGY